MSNSHQSNYFVLELPDSLNDMMPLYHPVAHGCKAGLYGLVGLARRA